MFNHVKLPELDFDLDLNLVNREHIEKLLTATEFEMAFGE